MKGSAPVFANFRRARFYDLFAITFVALLLISNICATKLIGIDVGFTQLVFDGGAVLFPLSYVLGDVLSEVYGFRAARRTILAGLAMSVLASMTFWVVSVAPPGPGSYNHQAFSEVLGFVPRIVAASLCGYVVGQLLNSFVLVRIKALMGERQLWARLIGSTLVGEAADTLIFCLIAFGGVISGAEMLNYILTGYVYKCALEVVLLPVTYPVIAWAKRREESYQLPSAVADKAAVDQAAADRAQA